MSITTVALKRFVAKKILTMPCHCQGQSLARSGYLAKKILTMPCHSQSQSLAQSGCLAIFVGSGLNSLRTETGFEL